MPRQLKKIKFHNYKCFQDFELECDKITTLIGENGIGKSTILDGINEWNADELKLSPKTQYNAMKEGEEQYIEYTFDLENEENELYTLYGKKLSIKKSDTGISITNDCYYFTYTNSISLHIEVIKKGANFSSNEINQIETFITNLLKFKPEKVKSEIRDTISFEKSLLKKEKVSLKHLKDLQDFNIKNFNGKLEIKLHIYNGSGYNPQNLNKFIRNEHYEVLKLIKSKFHIYYLSQKHSYQPLTDIFDFNQTSDSYNIKNILIQEESWKRIVSETDYAVRANYLEEIETKFNSWLKTLPAPVNTFQFKFQSLREKIGLLVRDSNNKLLNLKSLSTGIQWIFRFLFTFYPLLIPDLPNFNHPRPFIILIDEPGQSLHYKSQSEILSFLLDIGEVYQLFYSTHYHELVDYEHIQYIRFLKRQGNMIVTEKEPFNSRIFIEDLLRNISLNEAAINLAKNHYDTITTTLLPKLIQTNLVKDLHDHYEHNIESEESSIQKQMGTKDEDPISRFVYDSHFLTLPAKISEIKAEEVYELKEIYLVQLFKNEEKIENKNRFNILCENWRLKRNCLVYPKEKRKIAISKIKIVLQKIEDRALKIKFNSSLLLFPECIFPIEIIETLMDFAQRNEFVICGGFEHILVSDFKKKIQEMEKKFTHLTKYLAKLKEEITTDYGDYDFLNVAAIIWKNNTIVFQIKNNPAKLGDNQWEGIKTRKTQTYEIIESPIGRLSCFICRDFLVNHNSLPKWMDIHDIKLLLIPSFTSRVVPFLNRLKQITTYKSNSEKIFVYTNLAEYAGSDVINFANRMTYEPTQDSYYQREEGIFIFNLLEMNKLAKKRQIYKPEFQQIS